MESNYSKISKVLTMNDCGETGAHQAGIVIPKDIETLMFFPRLNHKIKNPRETIIFNDEDGGMWEFNFIYYNNKLFGGTRNEFRLTGMTEYLKKNFAKPGDELIFEKDGPIYNINLRKASKISEPKSKYLVISKKWKYIKIKGK